MSIPAALLLLTLFLLVAPAWAKKSDGGVQIDPGEWRVTTTSKYPGMDEATVETEIRCLRADHFTPERLVGEATKSCKIKKSNVTEQEMNWKVKCKIEGGDFRGTGSIKSTGSKASGTMTTTVKLSGQSLVSEVSWEGKRLRECGRLPLAKAPRPMMTAPVKSERLQKKEEQKEKKTQAAPSSAESQGN